LSFLGLRHHVSFYKAPTYVGLGIINEHRLKMWNACLPPSLCLTHQFILLELTYDPCKLSSFVDPFYLWHTVTRVTYDRPTDPSDLPGFRAIRLTYWPMQGWTNHGPIRSRKPGRSDGSVGRSWVSRPGHSVSWVKWIYKTGQFTWVIGQLKQYKLVRAAQAERKTGIRTWDSSHLRFFLVNDY